MKKHILYISYDGITDPLGQSQILPYLKGLSSKYRFTLIGCEKEKYYETNKEAVFDLIKNEDINWYPLSYHKKPPILSTLWDLWTIYRESLKVHKKDPYEMVHCRSHIPAIIGELLKKKIKTKFLFDMRSFYADERVDGHLWPQNLLIYRWVFKFFKKKEKKFLSQSDHTVVLTDKAKNIISGWDSGKVIAKDKVTVIPCCADLDHFNYENISGESQEKLRKDLKLSKDDFVVSYLGSVGTWYLLDEMLEYFKCLKQEKPEAKFLFITPEKPEFIIKKASKYGLKEEDFRIQLAQRKDVPAYLSLSSISLFFIIPTFSKQASSPTKHGEIMGMGVPVVANAGVGDTDDIIKKTETGLLIEKTEEASYKKSFSELEKIKSIDPEYIRKKAYDYFSLQEGQKKYLRIYEGLLDA